MGTQLILTAFLIGSGLAVAVPLNDQMVTIVSVHARKHIMLEFISII